MLYIYEFELVQEDDGWIVVYPFDFEGGTQGEDYAEASFMAADWLKVMLEHMLAAGEDLPKATLGNEPKQGGRVLVVAIEVDAEACKRAAEALRLMNFEPYFESDGIAYSHAMDMPEEVDDDK